MGKEKEAVPKEGQKQQPPKQKKDKNAEVECSNGVCFPKEKVKQNNPDVILIVPKSKKQKEKELREKELQNKK